MAVGIGAGGGSLLAQAYMRIRVNRSQLAGELNSCVKLFKSSISTMIGTAAGLGGALIARSGLHSFTSAIRSVGEAFIHTNEQMENFTISLGVLLHSEQRAASLMREIESFAAVTPFQTQNLAEAVTQLKVFGFETEKLMPMMKTLGDAASASPAGMQVGLKRIIYAMGQIKATGKVSMKELRQLALAGIPVWDILAQKSGKTVSALRDQIKKGALSADLGLKYILSGMDERFGGMMAKQSRTWHGLMSTMTDNAQIFARKVSTDFFEMFKGKLSRVVDWTLSPNFTRTTEKIRSVISEFSAFASKKIDVAIEWLKGDGAEKTAKWVKEIATSFVEISTTTFTNVMSFLASEPVREMASALKEVVEHLVTISTTKLVDFTKWLNGSEVGKFAKSIADASSNVGALVGNLMTLGGAYMIVTKLTGLLKLLAAGTGQLGLAMVGLSANPIGALVTALGLLATAYISAKLAGDGFIEHLMHLAHNILGVDTALSKLENRMAGEKKDNKANTAVEDALKAGDGRAARAALDRMKAEREKLRVEIEDLKEKNAEARKFRSGNPMSPASGMIDDAEMAERQRKIEEKRQRRAVMKLNIDRLEGVDDHGKPLEREKKRKYVPEGKRPLSAWLDSVTGVAPPAPPDATKPQPARTVREAETQQRLREAATAISDSPVAQWAKEQAEDFQRRQAAKQRKNPMSALGGIIGNTLLHPLDTMNAGREDRLKQIGTAHKEQIEKESAEFEEAYGIRLDDKPEKWEHRIQSGMNATEHERAKGVLAGKAKRLDLDRTNKSTVDKDGRVQIELFDKDKNGKLVKQRKDEHGAVGGNFDDLLGKHQEPHGTVAHYDPMSFVKHLQTQLGNAGNKAREEKAAKENAQRLGLNNDRLKILNDTLIEGKAKVQTVMA